MMEEKNNLVYWEERRINSLENEETNVQRNIFKYEIVRKADLLDFIKCLFSNAFDVPERIDEMIIYYNDGTNEATNVFGKSKKRRYILEAMDKVVEHKIDQIIKICFNVFNLKTKRGGTVELIKHYTNKNDLHELYMREHHIEIETEKDYEELKLKNVANALYEMNYNVCCEYCTEKKCNNKVIYEKCMDGITDYFREILEIKKEKSGYK